MSRYDFFIKYRLGKANPANGPSRRLDYRLEGDDLGDQHLLGLHFRLCRIGKSGGALNLERKLPKEGGGKAWVKIEVSVVTRPRPRTRLGAA